MRSRDLPEGGSTREPIAGGIGWEDFAAARRRFLHACRRESEITCLERGYAAPCYKHTGATDPVPRREAERSPAARASEGGLRGETWSS